MQGFRGPKPFSCLSSGPRQRFRGPKPVNVARFIPLTGDKREAGKDQLDSLRGTREAGKNQLDSLGGTREAGKDQLDLRGTREAGKDQLDSLRGTRRQERAFWTAWEAPGRHKGDL